MAWLQSAVISALLFIGSLFGVGQSPGGAPHLKVPPPPPVASPITGRLSASSTNSPAPPGTGNTTSVSVAATTSVPPTQGRGWTIWIQTPAVDVKTLTFLDSQYGGPWFAKDKNHVYMCCTDNDQWVVPGADPTSFTLLDPGGYYEKDNYRVYLWGALIDGADPRTFSVLSGEHPYGKDARHVYIGDNLIAEADPATFEFYDSYKVYSHDKTHVFWDGNLLPGVDPESFVTLPMNSNAQKGSDAQYGKDAHHVYMQDTIVQGADPATFVMLTYPTATAEAKDATHYYQGGEVVK